MSLSELETSFNDRVADHRKIDCEASVINADRFQLKKDDDAEESDRPEVPPDFPPESFWLSKDAEFDWFDRNAFFERKESTKASSHSANLNPNLNQQSNSNSQRFSLNLKSKASIIGLPKPQNTNYVDAKNRRNCKSGNIHLFPKRSGSGGKSVSSLIEPSSPKVSCMGRVRSKKDRNRRNKNHHSSSTSELVTTSTTNSKIIQKQKKGFIASFRAIFRSGGKRRPVVEPTASVLDSPHRENITGNWLPPPPPEVESPPRMSVESEPPGLGGLQRFASGRRSSFGA